MLADPQDAQPDTADALCQRAARARARGEWAEAIAAAEKASRLDPASVDGWVELSLAELAIRHRVKSLDAARQAIACDVACAPAQRALALALLSLHDVAGAENAIAAALRNDPIYPEGIATLALVRMMQGRMQEADALFRQALGAKATMAEAIGNHATLLARTGREREALDAAERAIALKPFLPGPHALRGALLHRKGCFAEAANSFAAALAADTDSGPELHVNRTTSLRLAGQPQAAARIGLDHHPQNVTLLANLGAALQAAGSHEEALTAYKQALKITPGLAEVENNIGRLHLEGGQPRLALNHMRRAFTVRPTDPDIAHNFAALLLDIGSLDEATRAALCAMDTDPQSPTGPLILGKALARQGRGEQAEAAFSRALRLDPARVESWFQVGTALLQADRRVGAASAFRQLCRLAPGSPRHWALLGQSLRGTHCVAADDTLRADLLAAFAQSGTEKNDLAETAISLTLHSVAARLWDAATRHPPDMAVRALLHDGSLEMLSRDPLIRTLLEHCLISDPELECALTLLRRIFLAEADGESRSSALDNPDWLPFLCALAAQGFLNEYVFAESAQETEEVVTLAARLEVMLATGITPDPARVALLAAYRPLHRWAGAAALLHHAWPEPVARLLVRQLEEPQADEALKAGLPRLTSVDDTTSATVRAQYEENPYPRWTHAGLLDTPIPLSAALRTMFPHVTITTDPRWDAPEVLIAGCGTGREAAWTANHFRGARVLAVDLSLASLAHAAGQSRRLGIDIAWAQADILKLGAAFASTAGSSDGEARRFDVIHCVGVLHHMADPLAGWTVLRGLLRPRGLMKIGLYSARARRPVVAARDFIAAHGYPPSTVGIRRFRQDVFALPEDHPVKPIMRSPDFHSTSACRDLVFHVNEHRHDLPQIASWLESLEFEFLGFQLEDLSTAALYRERFPEDPTMTDLTLWDRFEAEFPHSFGQLYQFWVRSKS
ncbi:tetratricopeptide repeat protein [Azospirillum sp.]|uniref:tetratricopeptide repeat protein n=1 Tax=Azospirillum sp. TaxID=34012 RepID=UPI002619B494|nr:tetratricopeptide repeat protein [Azospirillum sp.]